MRTGDEVGAEDVWDRAYRALLIEQHLPTVPHSPEMIELTRRRMRYLLGTDPGGSWVAERNDQIVGIAQAHLRGGVWVLATLGVAPGSQDRGIGRELLDRALAYGDRPSAGAIFASPDPRAVHRYVRAGFELHPTATAFGLARNTVERQPGVRGGTADDIEQANGIDRAVRGTDRGTDLEFQLSLGNGLLVDDSGGYAVVRGGRVAMLSALDQDIATRLLLAAIARCEKGVPVDVSWITAEQQWAIRTLTRAGVPIHVHESIMMRGGWQPALPYLAHGIFG